MNEKMDHENRLGVLLIVALVQVVDIIIHGATNQLEAIRVLSNIIIFIAIVLIIQDKMKFNSYVKRFFLGVYVFLNVIFVLLNGISNPSTGEIRAILFICVGATVFLLTIWDAKKIRI